MCVYYVFVSMFCFSPICFLKRKRRKSKDMYLSGWGGGSREALGELGGQEEQDKNILYKTFFQ